MALSNTERIDAYVAALVEEVLILTDGAASQVRIDVQASGELPWQVTVPDDRYGHVGMAVLDAQPALTFPDRTPVTRTLDEGDA